jgi:hypothetical protein
MRARHLILALVMAAMPAIGVPSPAGAVPPTRGCSPAFLGPWTFQQILDEFPPPPEIPPEVIQAAFEFYDKNDDGTLCVMGLPNGRINVVDNAANVP